MYANQPAEGASLVSLQPQNNALNESQQLTPSHLQAQAQSTHREVTGTHTLTGMAHIDARAHASQTNAQASQANAQVGLPNAHTQGVHAQLPAQSNAQVQAQANARAQAQAQAQAHVQAQLQSQMQVQANAQAHVKAQALTQTQVHVQAHALGQLHAHDVVLPQLRALHDPRFQWTDEDYMQKGELRDGVPILPGKASIFRYFLVFKCRDEAYRAACRLCDVLSKPINLPPALSTSNLFTHCRSKGRLTSHAVALETGKKKRNKQQPQGVSAYYVQQSLQRSLPALSTHIPSQAPSNTDNASLAHTQAHEHILPPTSQVVPSRAQVQGSSHVQMYSHVHEYNSTHDISNAQSSHAARVAGGKVAKQRTRGRPAVIDTHTPAIGAVIYATNKKTQEVVDDRPNPSSAARITTTKTNKANRLLALYCVTHDLLASDLGAEVQQMLCLMGGRALMPSPSLLERHMSSLYNTMLSRLKQTLQAVCVEFCGLPFLHVQYANVHRLYQHHAYPIVALRYIDKSWAHQQHLLPVLPVRASTIDEYLQHSPSDWIQGAFEEHSGMPFKTACISVTTPWAGQNFYLPPEEISHPVSWGACVWQTFGRVMCSALDINTISLDQPFISFYNRAKEALSDLRRTPDGDRVLQERWQRHAHAHVHDVSDEHYGPAARWCHVYNVMCLLDDLKPLAEAEPAPEWMVHISFVEWRTLQEVIGILAPVRVAANVLREPGASVAHMFRVMLLTLAAMTRQKVRLSRDVADPQTGVTASGVDAAHTVVEEVALSDLSPIASGLIERVRIEADKHIFAYGGVISDAVVMSLYLNPEAHTHKVLYFLSKRLYGKQTPNALREKAESLLTDLHARRVSSQSDGSGMGPDTYGDNSVQQAASGSRTNVLISLGDSSGDEEEEALGNTIQDIHVIPMLGETQGNTHVQQRAQAIGAIGRSDCEHGASKNTDDNTGGANRAIGYATPQPAALKLPEPQDTPLQLECSGYVRILSNEAPTGKAFDVLKWWEKNAPLFPTLAVLARAVLGMRTSSVESPKIEAYNTSVSTLLDKRVPPSQLRARLVTKDMLQDLNVQKLVESGSLGTLFKVAGDCASGGAAEGDREHDRSMILEKLLGGVSYGQ